MRRKTISLVLLLLLLMFFSRNAPAGYQLANQHTPEINTVNEPTAVLPRLPDSQLQAVFPPCLLGTKTSNCRCTPQLTTNTTINGATDTGQKALPCRTRVIAIATSPNIFFNPLSGNGNTKRTRLNSTTLEGNTLKRMNFKHYALPPNAAEPSNRFEGRLIFNQGAKTQLNFSEIGTQYIDTVVDEDQLPIFDFTFLQFGSHLIPQQRGLINAPESSSWEWLLQPGRVWDEQDDNGFSRASIPFALQESGANCTHNGVLSFLFKSDGEISNVAVQIGGETCLYFRYDMWGMVSAEYISESVSEANMLISNYMAEVVRRMPVKPIAQLSSDYAEFGVDHSKFGLEQGPDMVTFGVAIDGTHYSSGCNTRYGYYPYCELMDLPSYSTAKTFFASFALALISQQQGSNIRDQLVADYIPECNGEQWADVTFENLTDMATGNYTLEGYESDESSLTTDRDFFQVFTHSEKIQHGCAYQRKSTPGTKMTYHSSDTYILGSALDTYVGTEDIFDKVVRQIFMPLGLSPSTYKAVRTFDPRTQMYASHGMTLNKDDFIKLAEFLTKNQGKINNQQVIDADIVDAMLLNTADIGLATFNSLNRYLNGVWTYDLGSNNNYNCPDGSWVSYMSGFGGIGVVMLPNDMVYYFVSDSGRFSFNDAALELHKIRSLCP